MDEILINYLISCIVRQRVAHDPMQINAIYLLAIEYGVGVRMMQACLCVRIK